MVTAALFATPVAVAVAEEPPIDGEGLFAAPVPAEFSALAFVPLAVSGLIEIAAHVHRAVLVPAASKFRLTEPAGVMVPALRSEITDTPPPGCGEFSKLSVDVGAPRFSHSVPTANTSALSAMVVSAATVRLLVVDVPPPVASTYAVGS